MPISAQEMNYLTAYMDEYYGNLSTENEEIGTFLRDSHVREAGDTGPKKLLDVACGPSSFYWALFLPDVTEFHGLDAREDSIVYLQNLVETAVQGDIEPRYLEIGTWHGFDAPTAETHVRDVAQKYRNTSVHDIVKPWPYEDGSLNAVMSCFGIDHVETPEEFLHVLSEARRVLAPGGTLTLATLCETSSWHCGGATGACLFTTAESLRRDLEAVGFEVPFLEERKATTGLEMNQGYEKMIFCRARKV